jgi:hypothetical protein
MRCGWPEKDIRKALKAKLEACETDDHRSLTLEIAAAAKAMGNSWPLRPKPVPRPKLNTG